MPACERCGGAVENKDNRGWFRDHCRNCIEAIAAEETSHREQCEDDDCLTCNTP